MEKINNERIINAKTILVPSESGLELEEDLKPIEIQFDQDFMVLEGCNSEGALDLRDMIEIDAVDLVGRSSESDARVSKSPQPKGYEEENNDGKENKHFEEPRNKSDVKPQYNNSVTFRKMQMQRNRNK